MVRPQPAPSFDDRPGISVIGSPKSTLELHETRISAEQYLEDVLVLHHGPDNGEGDFETMRPRPTTATGRTKDKIFADIPVPDEECERAWRSICAFEERDAAYKPTPLILTQLWASLCATLSSEGQAIDGPLDRARTWELVQDEGYPQPLLEAMVMRISADAASGDAGRRTLCT